MGSQASARTEGTPDPRHTHVRYPGVVKRSPSHLRRNRLVGWCGRSSSTGTGSTERTSSMLVFHTATICYNYIYHDLTILKRLRSQLFVDSYYKLDNPTFISKWIQSINLEQRSDQRPSDLWRPIQRPPGAVPQLDQPPFSDTF